MKSLRPLLAALALLLCCGPVLTACGSGVDETTASDELKRSHRRCTNDAGCYNGYVCVGGYCQSHGGSSGCTSDKDCHNGQICKSGKCQNPPPPPPPACGSNTDCRSGEVCVGGSCQACSADNQCAAGQVCQSGACTTPPPPPPPTGGCKNSDDCQSGDLCNNAVCAASACNQRAAGKTGIRATVTITAYQGVVSGTANGSHEMADGTLTNILWIFDPSAKDTDSVHLALNVSSAKDPSGLPREVPLSVGQVIEVEGEYIPASQNTQHNGKAVIHFTHSGCGFVDINGTQYR